MITTIFLVNQEIILVHHLEEGRTINGAYNAEELRQLRQEIVRKRRGKLTRGVLLLQDNARAHRSHVAITLAPECCFEVFPHPPYSRDLSPEICTQI